MNTLFLWTVLLISLKSIPPFFRVVSSYWRGSVEEERAFWTCQLVPTVCMVCVLCL